VHTDAAVLLQFVPAGDAQREEKLLRSLAVDVKGLKVGTVGFEHLPPDPDSPKAGLTAIEWATVALAASRGLRDLLRVAADWADRARHPVRVRIGKDEVIFDHTTRDQRDKIVESFFERHTANRS